MIDELKPQNLVDVLTLYTQYKPIYDKAESEINTTKGQAEYQNIRDKLFALEGLEPTTKLEKSKPESKEPQKSSLPLLTEIIKQFCDERVKGSNWQPSTLEEHEASYNSFVEYVGVPIDKITKEEIRDYKLALQKIPSNRNKKKVYKEKSIHDLVKLQLPKEDLACLQIRNITGPYLIHTNGIKVLIEQIIGDCITVLALGCYFVGNAYSAGDDRLFRRT